MTGVFRRSDSPAPLLLVPMAVLVLAADIGFIDLDNAAKLVHVASIRAVRILWPMTKRSCRNRNPCSRSIWRAHAFLAGQHQVSDLEPVPQRLVGVLKDRASDDGKAIAVLGAFLALPVPFARRQVIDSGVAATRAADALQASGGPSNRLCRRPHCKWERSLKLAIGHLRDGLRTLCHGGSLRIQCRRILPWISLLSSPA